jgi:mRNA interferase HicA
MKGIEFIRRVKELARRQAVVARVDRKRGKGSHMTRYFGDRKTVVRNPQDDLKTGTYKAMLKQLGIRQEDLEMRKGK